MQPTWCLQQVPAGAEVQAADIPAVVVLAAVPAAALPEAAALAEVPVSGALPGVLLPVAALGVVGMTEAIMEENITAAAPPGGFISGDHSGAGIRGRGTIRVIIHILIRTIRIIPITRIMRLRLLHRQRPRNI